jgi:MFS family permease
VALTPRLAGYLFSAALADALLPIFYIFLPLFAARLGANALELGLVGGASYAVYSFMPFVMGHFSDRGGSRKFFIISSFAVLSVVSILYSISNDPITLITVRIFEGIGWAMLWPAMEAAVTEDTTRDSRSSLAIYNYIWSGGAALGPLVGTLLVTTYSYRSAFFATGILFAFLILLNGATFWREKNPPPNRNFDAKSGLRSRSAISSDMRAIFYSGGRSRNLQVWTSLTMMSLSTVTSAVFFTFFGPYASSIGMTVVLIGAVTTTFGVVRFFMYVILANKSLRERTFDVRKRIRNLVVFACIASLSGLLLFVKDPTGVAYFFSFAIFGIGYSVVYAASQTTLIAETAPEQRGAAAGLFESSIGFGGVIGPIVAGAVSSSSLTSAFIVPSASLVFVLTLLCVLFFLRGNPRHRETSGLQGPVLNVRLG